MPSDRSLEDRIRAIEDRLEIYNLIASHPPSADTAGRDHIAACWVEDGVFEELWAILLSECEELGAVDWRWQAADGCMGKARLGGEKRAPIPLIEPNRAQRRA